MATHGDILLADVEQQLADFGEPVVVYPPAGPARAVVGIVVRPRPQMQNDPREQLAAMTVQLPNSAATGISGAEWNNRFEVALPRYVGGAIVRMRTVGPVAQDAAMITWELG